jgi:hypothetical protein
VFWFVFGGIVLMLVLAVADMVVMERTEVDRLSHLTWNVDPEKWLIWFEVARGSIQGGTRHGMVTGLSGAME